MTSPLQRLGDGYEDSRSLRRTEVECRVGKSERGPAAMPLGLVSGREGQVLGMSIWGGTDVGLNWAPISALSSTPSPSPSFLLVGKPLRIFVGNMVKKPLQMCC